MNKIKLEIAARAENVTIARVVTAAFAAPLDANVGEVTEMQTAVSEAVTNAIIHGYGEEAGTGEAANTVEVTFTSQERALTIEIADKGVGIKNIAAAREPLFTTKPEMERSGLGFTVMESFMDKVEVASGAGEGTRVTLTRKLA